MNGARPLQLHIPADRHGLAGMGQRNAEVDLAADELRIRLPIGTASSAIAFGAMYCEQLSQ
jgi:hypothetical protein